MATTKRKPVKSATPANKRAPTRADRCQPIRDRLNAVEEDIGEIRGALDEPDIPSDLRERLKRMLVRKMSEKRRILEELRRCERGEN